MAEHAELRRDLVVIGASAGGVDALRKIIAVLPADISAAILIVLHVWPDGPSVLPEILNNAGPITAVHPYDLERLEYSRIYVAPPDFHLLVEPGSVRVVRGPKENRHRPAVDPLFRSAASVYGPRVVGCILTGSMDDGTAGALAVKRHGGVVIAQDPAQAAHRGMPASAIENGAVDYILPLGGIAPRLIQLVMSGSRLDAARAFVSGDADLMEATLAEANMDAIEDMNRRGRPSVYACPDCNGTLWELDDNGLLRFRCRTGHAYTAASLAIEQSERLEQALWTAFRALEETASLHRRMAERARERSHVHIAAEHDAAAQKEEDSARVLRDVILKPRGAIEAAQADQVES